MADFFKSALGGIIGQTREGNDFVGQVVELGNQKLRVKRLIAEGGYAFVFVAQDLTSGKEYALKRLLANDEEKNKLILEEIQFLKRLSGHSNIIQFISAAAISKEQSDHGQAEYLILTELCTGGGLVEELDKSSKAPAFEQVLRIFYQTCAAVLHMHKQKPPIVHRDLKAENLLISTKGTIKLCDFGSATTKTHYPDTSWSAIQRSIVEDEIARNTTPMYRAPEMLDLYQNFPINEACDVWALGCLLFKLCFVVHPFEDSAKLRIINANYVIPDSDTEYDLFHDLIRGMLTVNPEERPLVNDIIERLQEIAQAKQINLHEAPTFSKMSYSSPSDTPERRPGYPQQSPQHPQQSESSGFGAAGSLFNSLKGGAGSVFKNIKDASSKVMETVSSTMNKSDLDISVITSRILVMSYPAEGMESAIKNNIDDVRAFLESKHHGSYAIYNLCQRTYRVAKFEDRVSECGWAAKKAPPLNALYAICKNMHLWLRQKPKNVCVVHCLDGKANSACVVAAFLVFCHLFENSSAALHLFAARRSQPGVSASQKRYINYIKQMVADDPVLPHTRPLLIKSITLHPVPMFNKMKNGCTPFVEVYIGEERVLSTSLEYERMRQHTLEDGSAVLPINTSVAGDVTVIVFHARSTFGGKIQGKITSMKICQVQFHTGFVSEGTTEVEFTQYDLDQLDTADKYPEMFHVTLDVLVSPKEKNQGERKFPWENVAVDKLTPKILFSSKDEVHQTFSEFAVSDSAKSRMSQRGSLDSSPQDSPARKVPSREDPAPDPNKPKPPPQANGGQTQESSNFFTSLDWFQQDKPADNTESSTPQPSIAEIGLLDDDSDEEDGFSSLRESGGAPEGYGRVGDSSTAESKDSNVPEANFFDTDFNTQNSQKQGQSADVDFLNMNTTESNSQALEAGVDLLNIGGESSNVDLLSGHSSSSTSHTLASPHKSKQTDLLGMSTDDSFDPFHEFSENRTAPSSKPNVTTSTKPADAEFDPFLNFGSSSTPSSSAKSASNITSSQPKQPTVTDTDFFAFMESDSTSSSSNKEPDLMQGWNTDNLQNFKSSPSHTPNNLGPGPGIHKSASTGSAMNYQAGAGMMEGRNSPSMSNGMGMGAAAAGGVGKGMNSNIGNVPKADPFAGLGNLGKTAFKATGGGMANQKPTMGSMGSSGSSTWGQGSQTKSPYMGFQSPLSGQSSQPQQQQPQHYSPQHKPQQQQQPPQQQQQQQKANYSSSVIGGRTERGLRKNVAPGSSGSKPKMTSDTFNDLLGDVQFTNRKENEPKTIDDMRKKTLAEEMDPDKLKVMEWTKGKEKNIRALICSLSSILWDGEERWKPVGMHEMVTSNQVKKWWRKAVLCVHPDKLTDDPNQPLAMLIFMELNDAWAKFEEEGSKSLY